MVRRTTVHHCSLIWTRARRGMAQHLNPTRPLILFKFDSHQDSCMHSAIPVRHYMFRYGTLQKSAEPTTNGRYKVLCFACHGRSVHSKTKKLPRNTAPPPASVRADWPKKDRASSMSRRRGRNFVARGVCFFRIFACHPGAKSTPGSGNPILHLGRTCQCRCCRHPLCSFPALRRQFCTAHLLL